ncbi:MAG: serine/threonine protein kinase [Polyangiaceae bacterium]|nr:serine/threonine protein kinase [Polyangiaceae bacterium]
MPPADPSAVPAPGEILGGKYRVEQLVGSGGMGAVVTAIQLDLGRRVALKIMPPRAAEHPPAVERFLREARAASAIQSDHVVRVFEVARTERGIPFLVMEYLPGVTLDQVIRSRGALTPAEAIEYVLQTCLALSECHAIGIVHRDLKPENIMVLQRPGQVGVVKVLDFGISKSDWLSLDSSFTPNLTSTTDVFGTPTHMSPEQVRSSKSVDHRADIWALGVVLYEALTGAPPFMAETLPALSAMIVSEEPVAPSVRRPDLPRALSDVVLACLAKRPSDRPQSVAELAERLAPFASAASGQHVERIRAVVGAAPSAAVTGRRPAGTDTSSSWGTTQRRRPRSQRSVMFGVFGGVVAFAAVLVALLALRRSEPSVVGVEPTAVAEPSLPARAVSPAAAEQTSEPLPAPAPTEDAGLAPPPSPPSTTPVTKGTGKRRDPLSDRF